MFKLGKRLTCPVCRDSGFFTLDKLAVTNGKIDCGNHSQVVEMVDLATLIEIGGLLPVVLLEEEVDFEVENMAVLHPDDFEFGGDYGYPGLSTSGSALYPHLYPVSSNSAGS